jgi:hypothetical protein
MKETMSKKQRLALIDMLTVPGISDVEAANPQNRHRMSAPAR